MTWFVFVCVRARLRDSFHGIFELASGARPKYLNDYLFEGFKAEVPQQLLARVAQALDQDIAGEIEMESRQTGRNALLKRILIDQDPSLFPEASRHQYVHHPAQARPSYRSHAHACTHARAHTRICVRILRMHARTKSGF